MLTSRFKLLLGILISFSAYATFDGTPGKNLIIKADGTQQRFANPGFNGRHGADGRDGTSPNCENEGQAWNVTQPSGGDGEDGGSGEDGGDGGDITVYYKDLAHIRGIEINNTPGAGGYGGSGGYGARGCNCSVGSWTITDPTTGQGQTYYCTSGRDGSHGRAGGNGRPGSYGRIFLVPGEEEVRPAMPSAYVDMGKMEVATLQLSQNEWAKQIGAKNLFSAKSRLSDQYLGFGGRQEVELSFQWKATRPLSDFSGWNLLAKFENGKLSFAYPNNLLVKSELVGEGSKKTLVISAALTTSEVANLRLQELSGNSEKLKLVLSDLSKVSETVLTSIHLKYQTVENGYYRMRYDAKVPVEALTITAGRIEVLIGKLGLKPEYLRPGLQVHAAVNVTRTLDAQSRTVNLGNSFYIRAYNPGDIVEVTQDSNLLTGSTVVGKVLKGDRFKIVSIQNNWASLKKLDDTEVKGWIQMSNLKPAEGN